MRRQPYLLVVRTLALGACALLLAGCVPGAGDEGAATSSATPEPTEAPAVPVEVLWETDRQTVGAVVVTGESVVAYAPGGSHGLTVNAWDAATGEELWSHEASPGAVAAGISLAPHVFSDDGRTYVASLALNAEGWHDLSLFDVQTGEDVIPGDESVWVTSRPGSCGEEDDQDDEALASSACVGLYDEAAGVRWHRITPGVGLEPVEQGGVDNSRQIGPDLYSTNDRDGDDAEKIVYAPAQGELWRTSYSEVFGGGYSSDGGWRWQRFDEENVLVGYGAVRPEEAEPSQVDYSGIKTVALDLDDGSVRWTREGFLAWCPVAQSSRAAGCAVDGVSVTWPDEDSFVIDGDVEVQGFDVSTGETTWTQPVADWKGSLSGGDGFASSRDLAIVPAAADADGYELLDLETGDALPLTWEVLPCLQTASYDYAKGSNWVRGNEIVEWSGGHHYMPCDENREPLDSPEYIQTVVEMVGEEGNGIWVVATADGLRAFDLGEADPS